MKTAAVILAAGQGVRMKSGIPKVLHEICGRSLLGHVVHSARAAGADPIVVVVGHGGEEVKKAFAKDGLVWVEQKEQKGTGHALKQAEGALAGFEGRILVLCGDAPMIEAGTLAGLLRTAEGRVAMVMACEVDEPDGYGRIQRDRKGDVTRIIEHRDASEQERQIREINSGAYVFDAPKVFAALEELKPANAAGEYYLTDALPAMMKYGRVGGYSAKDPSEVLGVNTRRDLALATSRMQDRILRHHLDNGVTIVAPNLTWIECDVEIGQDTVIEPFTVIRSGVKIGKRCEVGPFCQLRAGAVLEDHAEVGNFVELKKTRLGSHSKAKHLSYLGDTTIGEFVNIGAGTITANYDGVNKHATVIEDRASTGSHTVLVAPSTMKRGSKTGAGAVVVRTTVKEGDTVVGVPARSLSERKQLTPRGGRKKLVAPSKKRNARGA